jgi:hypothetical protein
MDLLQEHNEKGPRAAPSGARSTGRGVAASGSSDESDIDRKAPTEPGKLTSPHRPWGDSDLTPRKTRSPRLIASLGLIPAAAGVQRTRSATPTSDNSR